MSIVLKDALIFFGGYELTGQSNQIAIDLTAEALDETTFGMNTRKMRGGLKVGRISASGFNRFGDGQVDPILFEDIDQTETLIMIAPDTISEGSTSTGTVYAMKAQVARYSPVSGGVGDILPFSVSAEGRGV